MSTVDFLTAARKKIENRKNWLQGSAYRTKSGKHQDVPTSHTFQRCAGGAMAEVGSPCKSDAFKFLEKFMNGDIPRFNDTHTHAEVISAFDSAIAEASNESA